MTAALPESPLSPLDAEELRVPDWFGEAEAAPAPLRRRRLSQRTSVLVEQLTDVHASTLALVTAGVDFVLTTAAASLVRVAPPLWAPVLGLMVVGLAYVSSAYRDRDTVQTRGVLWYPGQVVVPVLGTAAAADAVHATSLVGSVRLAAATMLLLTVARWASWAFLVPLRRRGFGLRRTLIVAEAEPGALLWKRLVEFPEAGLLPTDMIDYRTAHEGHELFRRLERHGIQHVVFVTPGADDGLLVATLPRHEEHAPYFSVVPALSELFLDPRSVSELGGIPLIPLGRVTRAQRRFPGKRATDIVLSALLLLVFLPLFAAVAAAIKLGDRGPVVFRQNRVGRHGNTFSMLKFRSMVVGADAMLSTLQEHNVSDGLLFKLRDDPRVTAVGRWLRRTSLDELPQLWNVLKGEMSLVGPRPLAVNAEDFADAAAERHTVLPGMTGYWQLSGGSDLTYDEMVRLDLAYIRNWSLWLDLRLLLRTAPVLLNRRHGA